MTHVRTHSLSLFSSSPAHLLNKRINITIHPSSWIECLLFCCGFINCIINAQWQSYNPYPSYGGVMSCFAKFMLTSRRSHKLQNKTHVVQKHFQGDRTCLQGPKKPELWVVNMPRKAATNMYHTPMPFSLCCVLQNWCLWLQEEVTSCNTKLTWPRTG